MFSPENAGERYESKAPGAQGTRQYIQYGEGVPVKGMSILAMTLRVKSDARAAAQRRYRTAQQVFRAKP